MTTEPAGAQPASPDDRPRHTEAAEPDEAYAQEGPVGMPYTVYFPDGETLLPADLEHAAPLPRVGDSVEYIDERGTCRRYVVREVIHTLQAAAHERPAVHAREEMPAAFARDDDEEGENPGFVASLRAGLPKVILELAAGSADGPIGPGGFRVMTRPGSQPAMEDAE